MDAAYVEDGGYYVIKFTGLRTFDAIAALLQEVEKHAQATGVYKYLFDLRESEEGFSVVEKYHLGTYIGKLFGTRFRAAALLRKEHVTGFLENVSANRGAVRFIITEDEEKAIQWMTE